MSINKHLTESLSKNNFEQLSTAGSMASIKSGYDRDLITKFDDKRRAKYSLLKDLQAHDQGTPYLHIILDCIDETGKYKTNKCTIELFIQTAQKYGIECIDNIRDGLRDRVIPGSHNVIDYVRTIKEMHLKINQNADEN
jgi:hypothetical protein